MTLSIEVLTKLGTLSHNRSFTLREWLEYGGSLEEFHALVRGGLIHHDEARTYFLTFAGQEALGAIVERA